MEIIMMDKYWNFFGVKATVLVGTNRINKHPKEALIELIRIWLGSIILEVENPLDKLKNYYYNEIK